MPMRPLLTATRIRSIRLALGLSTAQLAARVGVVQNTVQRWEIGDRHPRFRRMVLLNELADEAAAKGVALAL